MPKSYTVFKPKAKGKIGGAEVQMSILAKELAKDKKFKVSFVVGDYGQPETESVAGLKIFKLANLLKSKAFFGKIVLARRLILILKKIDSDVYVTTTANSVVGVVNFFCGLFRKRHIHRTAHEKDVNGDFVRKNGLEGLIYLWGLKRANIVFVQNDTHQKLLKKNYKKESFLIRNSFELNNSKEPLGFLDRKYILQVTRFFDWKNPYLFLRLAKSFPRESFLLVCQHGIDPKEEKWLEFKNDLSKIKNVKLLERVAFDEIQSLFDEAKFFVNTSELEGFPNTFIQAGISGTPLVSFKVNPDNFINKFGCGFACEGSFIEVRKKTAVLIKDRETWKEKSVNVFDYVKRNHDIKRNIKSLKNLLVGKK